VLDGGLDGRAELDRRRASTDHRDALAGQVEVVVLPGGVEAHAGEAVRARQRRDYQVGKCGGSEHDVRAVRAPRAGLQSPHVLRRVPVESFNVAPQR
jgi:hypothetical protein